jgi:lipopolysaccharide export system protein LptC
VNGRTLLVRALLLVAAVATGWLAWQLRRVDEPPPLVGPPRSDYSLREFELIAFDEQGVESFSARGPRLARHHHLGTIEIEQPRFRVPDSAGDGWNGRAQRGWISADGNELRLLGDVDLLGPVGEAGEEPMHLVTPALNVFPREDRVATDAAVTVTGPGSILRGRGMRADLQARRVELLAEVKIRYEPASR